MNGNVLRKLSTVPARMIPLIFSVLFLLNLPGPVRAQTAGTNWAIRTITGGGDETGDESHVALAGFDFDNDTFGEFIVLTRGVSQHVRLFEATANNSYTLRSSFTITGSFDFTTVNRAMAVGNVDGDSADEIILAIGATNLRTIVLDVSTTTLALTAHPSGEPAAATDNPTGIGILGDTDGDNNPEFAIGNIAASNNIQVFEWNGSGWTLRANGDHLDGVANLTVGNVDSDNKPEIVVIKDNDAANGNTALAIFEFTGGATNSITSDGTISNNFDHSSTANSVVTLGDLDNNGSNEIIVWDGTSDDIRVYENTGGANYNTDAASGVHLGTTNPEGITVGDFDGDGDLEIYFADSNNSGLSRYIEHTGSNGSFTASDFASPVTIFSGLTASTDEVNSIAVSGTSLLDGDLFTDIVLTTDPHGAGSNPEIFVIEQTSVSVPPTTQTVTLNVSPASGSEAATTAVTVTASAGSAVSGDQTVDVTLSGTGVTPGDFTGTIPAQITILDGQTSGFFTVNVNDDSDIEGTETATFTISNPSSGLTLGSPVSDNVVITDSDFPSVTVNVSPATGSEDATTAVTVTATASQAVSGDQTVDVTLSGTGVTTGDFTGTIPAQITILDGQTSGFFTVNVNDDSGIEGAETATFTVSNPSSGLTLGSPAADDVIITDNDADLQLTARKTDVVIVDIDGDNVVDPGDRIKYTIGIKNDGSDDATSVVFTDLIPTNTTYVAGSMKFDGTSLTDAADTDDGDFGVTTTNTVTIDVGTVSASGDTHTICFEVDVDSPLAATIVEVCNQGTFNGDDFSGQVTDDPDTGTADDATCTAIDKDPDLTVTKTDALDTDLSNPGVVDPGDILLYTIIITNSGRGDATSVVLSDLAADHTGGTLVDGSVTTTQGTVTNGNGASDTNVAVDVGTIATSGGTATITFKVEVDSPFGGSELCNQGTVVVDDAQGNGQPDVKSDDPDTGTADDPTCVDVGSTGPGHGFLFLAAKALKRGRNITEGDIHSNGPLEFNKGNVGETDHTGNVTAVGKIKIRSHNRIDGDVISGDDLRLGSSVDITGIKDEDAAVAPETFSLAPFTANNDDRKVNKSKTLFLPPGTYGAVRLSTGATLELAHTGATGEYFFERLEFNKNCTLKIDARTGPVTMNVVKLFKFRNNGKMELLPGGGASSDQVTLNYLSASKMQFGSKVQFFGTIVAPNAQVSFSKDTRFKGSVCARQIRTRSGGVFLHHSSGTPLPPLGPESGLDRLTLGAGPDEVLPTEFALEANYPNPFNPSTTISFALPQASEVTLAIYNVRGQLVRTLVSGALLAGRHQAIWDGRDAGGAQVASGLYIYRMRAGEFVTVRKMLFAK